MAEDEKVIMAVPVGAPGYVPGDGYVQEKCDRCTRMLWLGPMSRELRNRCGLLMVCPECAIHTFGKERAVAAAKNVKPLNPNATSRCDLAALDKAMDEGWRP